MILLTSCNINTSCIALWFCRQYFPRRFLNCLRRNLLSVKS
jgi:hypothetical protein